MAERMFTEHRIEVHCANCAHCIKERNLNAAMCHKGYYSYNRDVTIPLWALMRTDRPRHFERASECEDFLSMGAYDE